MKWRCKTITKLIFTAISLFLTSAIPAQELTGDVRLACEAILCLSSGIRPSECNPSLKRYFGISHKKWSDTLKARKNFLNLCPTAGVDSKMRSLVDAIANGAGRCDIAALNTLTVPCNSQYGDDACISNQMPGYCGIYYSHEYTDLNQYTPVYVGTPSEGGFWTERSNYEAAMKGYNERLERQKRYWSD